MKFLKGLKNHFHIYILWILIVLFLWSPIFELMTDTVPSKKIIMYINVYAYDDPGLDAAMEGGLSKGQKMVQVKTFSDGQREPNKFLTADLYLCGDADFLTVRDCSLPLTEFKEKHPEYEYCEFDGVPYGVKVFDYETEEGAMKSYITYKVREEDRVFGDVVPDSKNYYVFLCSGSRHSGTGDAKDAGALSVLEYMLTLP